MTGSPCGKTERPEFVRLMIVNSTRKWGGVKTWSLRTARSLAERGHQVTVVGRSGDPFVQACRDAGLDSHGMSFGASWSPARITLRSD